MRDIGAPLSPFKSLKEVAELMAADGKQRPSKSGMQTCRGLPANLRRATMVDSKPVSRFNISSDGRVVIF